MSEVTEAGFMFRGKPVSVCTGEVSWVETYKTYRRRTKQTMKLAGMKDVISTCEYMDTTVKKGDTVSVYTVAGNNELIAIGRIGKGDPSNLEEVNDSGVTNGPDRIIVRNFTGEVAQSYITKRYGRGRQWIRTYNGQLFVTRKYVNEHLEPGDSIKFQWFWCKNIRNLDGEDYRVLCSPIEVISKKHR